MQIYHQSTVNAVRKTAAANILSERHSGMPIEFLETSVRNMWLAYAHIAFKSLGLGDKDSRRSRLEFVSALFGMPINSTIEMSPGQIWALKTAVNTFRADMLDLVEEVLDNKEYAGRPEPAT